MNHNQTYRFWRAAAQCLLGGIAVAVVTFACFRLNAGVTTAALLYLIIVVLASLTGSFVLSAVVSIIAILCLDYFFTAPFFSLTMIEPLDAVALATFLGTALVITSLMSKRKRAEEVLREQASLLNLTHDTIFVRDMSDVITYWNRGAEELYGWTARGSGRQDALTNSCRRSSQHRLKRSMRSCSAPGVGKGNSSTRSETGHRSLWRAGGHCSRTSKAGRSRLSRPTTTSPSASERRKKFANSTHELEQRVIERTAELEATNKELEAFAYSVSHDLRAPLRHMAGYAELLQKNAASILDEKSRRYMTMILESAKRMGDLIDDLLAFSRIGRAETQKTLVSLEQLVKEALNEVQPETDGRNIGWRIGALPNLYGDRSMLRLALVNLISNAS